MLLPLLWVVLLVNVLLFLTGPVRIAKVFSGRKVDSASATGLFLGSAFSLLELVVLVSCILTIGH